MDLPENSIFDRTPVDWRQFFQELSHPAFRGEQVFTWIHRFGVSDPAKMTNLSRELRETLVEKLDFSGPLRVSRVQRSRDGSVKFGFLTRDNHVIESVLIAGSGRDRRKYTVCVSSQVGCPLGCAFCATAGMGFTRNLACGEIVAQVHLILDFMAQEPDTFRLEDRPRTQWLTNIVYMGMGEPLLNLPEVLKSVDILADPSGLDFSLRRITLSTAGWVPGLEELAKIPDFRASLAVSLHACDNVLRSELMPVNRKYPVETLREALGAFPLRTRARITLEYILLEGLNDSPAHARSLLRFCEKLRVKINLIPYHDGGDSRFKPSSAERRDHFVRILRNAGLTVIERSSAGADIDAACGQLAAREKAHDDR